MNRTLRIVAAGLVSLIITFVCLHIWAVGCELFMMIAVPKYTFGTLYMADSTSQLWPYIASLTTLPAILFWCVGTFLVTCYISTKISLEMIHRLRFA